MKANKLMIGDLVYDHRKWACPIVEIHKYTAVVIAINYVEEEFRLEDLRPIPLTPEILENNGFIANEHVYPYPYYEYIVEEDKLKIGFAFPQGNRTSYKEPWIYIDSERVFVEHLPCIYVHELQHALRLCGIKKEIVL